MKRNFQKLLLPFIIAPFLFAIPLESSQQSFVNSPVSTIEITKTGLEISKSLLEQNDIDGAKYAAKFASEHFALDLINLREYDSDLTDEIHIKLLDLYPSVKSDSIDNSLETIDETISELDDYEITEDNSDLIVVDLLTVADEQYTIAITDENESAYLISKSLFQKSKQLFEENADLTVMLDLEQQSFFNDIEKAVKNKESFLTVGTIVSAIQRDLLGTETLVHDQSVLYEKIRTLYSQMLESIDAGDYEKAEELAIEAYLENFEYLEPALEIVDAEFMYALEIDMREELRDMIVNEQDPTIIRTFVEKSIIPDLNEGESKVMAYLDENPQGFVNTDRELKERGESTDEQQSEVRSEIDFIRSSLEEMMVHYENEDYSSAYATARTAYLDSYEYVEIPLRPIAPDFTLEVEYQFAELRNLIKERAPVNEVREVSTQINRNLDESERLVTGTGAVAPWIAFTASFSIIFREGLEAVLILGAILTYLEASRNNKFKPYIHYGVIIAI
ncbi:MAG: FTR1 family protein, partial [Nitrosopumilaceae archaeon]|nr:FTR1 family protein [Nitrosopumilaceae archaeon]